MVTTKSKNYFRYTNYTVVTNMEEKYNRREFGKKLFQTATGIACLASPLENLASGIETLNTKHKTATGVTRIASPLENPASETQTRNTKHKHEIKYDFYKDPSQILLAKLIYGEARSELNKKNQLEAEAIGQTPENRVNNNPKLYGKNIKEVILRKYQYSCFNPGNPNLEELKSPAEHDIVSWAKSLKVMLNIYEGKVSLPNLGQTHYHLKNMKEYPNWSKSEKMARIETPKDFKHIFYIETA